MTISLAVLMICQILGKVVAVSDGDTLIVRESPARSLTVRLIHIDAPERGQAFGTRARQTLGDLVDDKQVEVIGVSKDRYGRTLGEVRHEGRSINLEMVRLGMAWSYADFSPPEEIVSAQNEARQARRGLWADTEPMPPWDYRKQRRTAAAK